VGGQTLLKQFEIENIAQCVGYFKARSAVLNYLATGSGDLQILRAFRDFDPEMH
jgi:hypothetical protein